MINETTTPDRVTPASSAGAPAGHAGLVQQLEAHGQRRRADDAQRSLHPRESTGKHIHLDGRTFVNLAGNDYLGFATHPALKAAAVAATQKHGTGSSASRLITGTLPIHLDLERRFAEFKHGPAALLFSSGTAANMGVLLTLARPGDLILQDKLNHACLIDGARFCGAKVRTFPHRNYEKLERLLQAAPTETRQYGRRRTDKPLDGPTRTFITTDSVFSMEGTTADLPRLLDLCDKYHATLLIDEAHGTGVLGEHGTGLAEHQGVAGQVHITVSTASKALGSLGGIVTADEPIIDELINHARTFVYTTSLPPAIPASIHAALDLLRDEPHHRYRLAEIVRRVRGGLRDAGWDIDHEPTPIVPLVVGPNDAALALSLKLREAGFLAAAIRPPTVPPNAARVRLSLRADLTDEECDTLIRACTNARGLVA
ncbi:MAG: 8-amino-7-oxononanoate synthase [Planctomycetota bacterium]